MKPSILIILKVTLTVFAVGVLFSCENKNQIPLNRDRDFNSGWKFIRENALDAEKPEFDDSDWRLIDLPHDWSAEYLPLQGGDSIIGPFSRTSPGGPSSGYVMGGTGWYRKHFTVENKDRDKKLTLIFDGVYMETDVWINGQHLGFHAYGYTPFYFDLTPYLDSQGKENVLAVRVVNEGKNTRWYSGSGIYRDITLRVTNSVHVALWSVCITTPEIKKEKAVLNLAVKIHNEEKIEKSLQLLISLFDPSGIAAGEATSEMTIPAGESVEVNQTINISNPAIWSPVHPDLYMAEIKILSGGKVMDTEPVVFGIRSFSFSAEGGFLLNGKMTEMKGACMHHDNGLLGSAAFRRAEERRIEIMKANGYNAIRTSHNPPSEAFLDACDRLGMLVIDEAFDMWEHPKNLNDYSNHFKEWWNRDLESMLLRDRNHPSVIIWSIGNEIYERADTSGNRIARQLTEKVKQIDPTRPVTAAICHFWDHPGLEWDANVPAFRYLDIGGYNYQWKEYESDHKNFPGRIMMGTESVAMEAFENWDQVVKHAWVIGDFVWTGMDYLGEAGIGHSVADTVDAGFFMPWPYFNSWCGDIDICGNKKPQSYFRDVVWGLSDLEMAVHSPVPPGWSENVSYWGWPDEQQSWTWPGSEGKSLKVKIYSNCEVVRLELNDKMVGEQHVSEETRLTATFKVPYEPGELKATGFKGNQEMVVKTFKTAGEPKFIKLNPDRDTIRADRDDLCFVSIEIYDESGLLIPNANIPVSISMSGDGELAASGNASPDDMESFRNPYCKTYHGKAMAILRPYKNKGKMVLTVESDNLSPASCEIIIE